MEHWAKAVIETVDSIPETPPPSPVILPTATTKPIANRHSLPPDRARTIDLELARLGAPSSEHGVNRKKHHSINIQQINHSSCESPTLKKPATWRLGAALLAGAFQQSLSTGLIMTYGTILSYYTTNLLRSTSSTQLNLIGAVPAFFLLALALPFGHLLDLGYHQRLNVVAGVLVSASLFSLTFTTHHHSGEASWKYYAVLLCAIPLGVGQSIYFLSSTHMVRTWLPRRTGLALGVVNAGAALGGSLFPLLFTHLTTHHTFPLAILSLAAIATCLSLFIILFAVPHPHKFAPPSCNSSSRTPSSFCPTPLLNAPVILFSLATCALYAGILSVPFYLPTWSALLPLSAPPRVSLVTVMNLSQLPGRVLASVLADVVSARWLHVGVLVGAGCVVPGFWYALVGNGDGEEGFGNDDEQRRVLAAAYAFACVYGVCHGGVVALVANGAGELLTAEDAARKGKGMDVEVKRGSVQADAECQQEVNEGRGSAASGSYGQLSGVIYTVAAPFVLAGPLVNGRLVDTMGIKAIGVWAAGCFGLAACLMSVSLAVEQARAISRKDQPRTYAQQTRASLARGSEDGPSLRQENTTKGDSWDLGCWRVAVAER